MLEIPDRELALGALSDEDVLARLDVFRDEQSTRLLLGELEMCRENGNVAGSRTSWSGCGRGCLIFQRL